MTPGRTLRVGLGASFGATNLGSVALTVHRHEIEIKAPTQDRVQETKRFKGPTCRSEGPKTKLEQQDIVKRKASFVGQASTVRDEATPSRRRPRHPGRACRE